MRKLVKAGLWCLAVSGFFTSLSFAQEGKSARNDVRSIEQSVHLALQSHPQLSAARQVLLGSQEQLAIVEADLLPKVALTLGLGREDSNNATTRALQGSGSQEMERRESAITLSQMLFDGFRVDNRRMGQHERIRSEEWILLDFASELAIKAVQAHLAIAKSNKVLEDHLVNLQVHEQIAKDIGLRVRSGKDDRARVSQISARLSLALANLEAAKNQVLSAKADYLREVGEPPLQALAFQGILVGMPDSERLLIDKVLQQNPFLLAKRKELDAKSFEALASRSGRFPSLFLESGASWNANLDGQRGRNSDVFVMLRMRYELYKGGADRAVERQATFASQQVRYELDDLIRELRREASQAWLSYQSNAKRVGFLRDYSESAQVTKAAYSQQFNIGQRTLIDLLDAENELLRARTELHEAQYSLMLSKYQMLKLQGKLLSSMTLDDSDFRQAQD